MKITGIIRRVDDLGRIVIPKEIRRQVFGKTDVTGEPRIIILIGIQSRKKSKSILTILMYGRK